MSRASSYTPAWLSRPSPGFDFFNKPQSTPVKSENSQNAEGSSLGPSRTLAYHGTQIFAVVGNELRWSDLVLLKEQWELNQERQMRGGGLSRSQSTGFPDDHGNAILQTPYRVLKVPVSLQIRQLLINPTGDYMAIITSHTVHIAVLPDPSHLTSSETSELKLKTFQLGPTVHVVERSPVASALWHPLGVQGTALVTIAADSVVRLWEIDRNNRWSFDSPNLAFDLKKLADGRSSAEDFSPSKYGTGKGFSPDSFEMEVASACFGGTARPNEPPLAAMTLWVAMKEGDVYALCPLLPSKWDPPEALLKNLSSTIRCQAASSARSENLTAKEQKLQDQRLSWLSEIEKQTFGTILQRPSTPAPIPKLQGPFRLAPDPDLMFNISDIYTVNPSYSDSSESQSGIGDFEDEFLPSIDFICLATNDESVYICANMDAVEASWLPLRMSSHILKNEKNEVDPELLVIESVSLSQIPEPCWPTITTNPLSETSIFVTHHAGVTNIDLSPLTSRLLKELNQGTASGSEFRLGMLVDDSRTSINQPITIIKRLGDSAPSSSQPTACINLFDSDLGHFLMTISSGQPYAVTLADGDEVENMHDGIGISELEEANFRALIKTESRPTYQPPEEFWQESALQTFMDQHVHSRYRRLMSEEVQLSPLTLNLLMEAHRVLSYQTHRLGVAAGDLFSQCQRLLSEYRERITRTREVSSRVNSIVEADIDLYNDLSNPSIAERLETARERQEKLTERYDKLRKNLSLIHGRALSEKEQAWMNEIQAMNDLLSESKSEYEDARNSASISNPSNPTARLNNLKVLQTRLLADAQEAVDQANAAATAPGEGDVQEANTTSEAWNLLNVKPERRRARLAEINGMLERQTALVEATRSKLEKLNHAAI